MMDVMYLLLCLTFFFAVGVLSDSLITPCKQSDTPCIEKSLNIALPKIFNGIPELEVDPSDPQFIPFVDGDLSTLRYMLFNSSIFGFKTCVMSNLELNNDLTNARCDMNCPELSMSGHYNLTGQLLSLPVAGHGDFTFVSREYLLKLNVKLEKVQGSDGKNHIFIKKINIVAKPLASATYDFKNLYDGQKDLADKLKSFVKQNWQTVAELVQNPIWSASMAIMTKTFNTYLKHVVYEDVML